MNTIKLKDIKKINWQLVVSFRTELLTEYLIQTNHHKMIITVGLPFKKRLIIDNDIYNEVKELNNVAIKIEKNLFKIADKIFYRVKKESINLLNYSQKISKKDFSKLINKQLLLIFNKWLNLYGKAIALIGAPNCLDIALENAARKELEKYDIQDREAIFKIVSHADQWSGVFEEKIDLLRLSLKIKDVKIKKHEKQIIDHATKYSWINLTLLLGNLYTVKDVKKKLNSLRKNEKLKIELDELQNNIKQNKKELAFLRKQYKFDRNLNKLIKTFRHAIWFRTARLDWLNMACASARPLFSEIAERIKLTSEELVYLFPGEISNSFKQERLAISKKEINRRMNKYAMTTLNGKLSKLFLGKEIDQIKKWLVKEETKKEIKGMIAYPGIIRGFAKIVKDRTELSKVEKKDILISKLTTPDFISAMEKASAIVTDLGGITSHAAIISRELHIPCIVGTKIATKVLKDGDLIEVDADKGIVRKLE